MKIVKANQTLTSEALNAEMILNENVRKANEIARSVWTEIFNPVYPYKKYNKTGYNGNSYICLQNGTGKTPDSNPTYWQLIVAAGAGLTDATQLPITDTGDYYTVDNTGDALQEIGQRIGDLTTLETESNTDLVGALNEVNSKVDDNTSDILNKVFKGELAINVKDYGAVGDGVTDDTAAIQSALTEGMIVNGTVFFPQGRYIVTSSFNINDSIKIVGVDSGIEKGSVIQHYSNSPLFYVTASCTFDGLNLLGVKEPTYTLADGIFLDNVNNVYIRNCFFNGFYNNIHLKDTVFYSYLSNCVFYSCIHASIYGDGTSTAGYAIQVNDCQVISSEGQYGFRFKNAGSVVLNTVQMSPLNLTVASLCFESLAPQAGIQQINNCGFESSSNHSIELIGTQEIPIKFVFFTDCYIASNIRAVYIDYANYIHFDNCYFTGDIAFYTNHYMEGIYVNNCEFQTTSSAVTCSSVNCTNFSLDIVNPSYQNTTHFIYLPFLNPLYVKRLSVIGGTIGTNAIPIYLPDNSSANVNIDVMGQNLKPYKIIRLTGTLDGSGNATVPHGVSGLHKKALVYQGFHHNGNYLAQPLALYTISATDISVVGGTVNGKYRISIMYTENDDANWIL